MRKATNTEQAPPTCAFHKQHRQN